MIADFAMHDQILQDLLSLTLLLLILLWLCLYQSTDREFLFDNAMDILLKASHFADYILDDLRGQLFKNLILGSSQDKGCYSFLEAFKGFDKGLSFLQFLRETLDVASKVLIVLLIED